MDEYYKSKGIDVDELTATTKKEPAKKGEVNAEWIKKEKLTVLETKEDKKNSEQQPTGGKKQKRQFNEKVGVSENLNSELFGFNAVQPKRQEREQQGERREPREHR